MSYVNTRQTSLLNLDYGDGAFYCALKIRQCDSLNRATFHSTARNIGLTRNFCGVSTA
jgi:hypothetical protein